MPIPEVIQYENPQGLEYQIQPNDLISVVEYDGDTLPPYARFSTSTPNQRGTTDLGSLEQERALTYLLITKTADASEMRRLKRLLSQVFDPTLGEGTLKVFTADDLTRYIKCKYTAGLEGSIPAVGRFSLNIPLSLVAGSPYWYNPVQRVITYTGTGGGVGYPLQYPLSFVNTSPAIGSVSLIYNQGDAPTSPDFVFQGPMTNPVIHHIETGRYLKFLGSIPSGATFTVTTGFNNKTWTLNAYGTVYAQASGLKLVGGSNWFELAPGLNSILITNDYPHPGGIATMTFTERYKTL